MTHSPLAWLERLLFVVGLACLGWYTYATVAAEVVQREQQAQWRRQVEAAPAPASDVSAPLSAGIPIDPAVSDESDDLPIGLLEIPRLAISTTIMSGDDEDVLAAAAGHLPDTPRPWESGNSAIAAHRDGLFRPLKNIRRGDVVRLYTPRGTLEYRVDETKIVRPTDLSVLAPRRSDSLTLITCYPFNYVGSAPQRFIVHAERTGGHAQAADLLPSRSLVVFTSYGASHRRHYSATIATRHPTAAGARHARLARPRLSRGSRASTGAGRATARRADGASAQRDRRQRDATARDRRQGPDASRRERREDDPPAKTRRWYHFFQRRR
jgi:sortase A